MLRSGMALAPVGHMWRQAGDAVLAITSAGGGTVLLVGGMDKRTAGGSTMQQHHVQVATRPLDPLPPPTRPYSSPTQTLCAGRSMRRRDPPISDMVATHHCSPPSLPIARLPALPPPIPRLPNPVLPPTHLNPPPPSLPRARRTPCLQTSCACPAMQRRGRASGVWCGRWMQAPRPGGPARPSTPSTCPWALSSRQSMCWRCPRGSGASLCRQRCCRS